MLQMLKQMWPNHQEQFTGWTKFPGKDDYPPELRGTGVFTPWTTKVLDAAKIADNIEQNLGMFPDEGAFGKWIQCGGLLSGSSVNWANLHAALHFNGYPSAAQAHSVSNQRVNIDSYVFWKLHGYIDNIWERFRLAKGHPVDDPVIEEAVYQQCTEMHTLAGVVKQKVEGPSPVGSASASASSSAPTPSATASVPVGTETGYFVDNVRTALKAARCNTCHGAGAEAGLHLGDELTATELVNGIVGRSSNHASGYAIIVPGDPTQSWLYLKASGLSETLDPEVACISEFKGVPCTQGMPPSSTRMNATDLEKLRQWILMGAPKPTLVP
jgi:hypothetical protein